MVNIERAARFGDEIGGHVLSGHIMDQVTVLEVQDSAHNRGWCGCSDRRIWRRFCWIKAMWPLNGCSLTIAEVQDDRFAVYLIPETRDVTTFGEVQPGSVLIWKWTLRHRRWWRRCGGYWPIPQLLAQLRG